MFSVAAPLTTSCEPAGAALRPSRMRTSPVSCDASNRCGMLSVKLSLAKVVAAIRVRIVQRTGTVRRIESSTAFVWKDWITSGVTCHFTVILSRRRARSAGGRSKDPQSTGDGFRNVANTQGVLRRPPALRVLRQPQDDRFVYGAPLTPSAVLNDDSSAALKATQVSIASSARRS